MAPNNRAAPQCGCEQQNGDKMSFHGETPSRDQLIAVM
jgi:hypothetical protein